MFEYWKESDDVIMHYGVNGQKWGVRRYQNEDGSLTEEGRIHYGYGQSRWTSNKRGDNTYAGHGYQYASPNSKSNASSIRNFEETPGFYEYGRIKRGKNITDMSDKSIDADYIKATHIKQNVANIAATTLSSAASAAIVSVTHAPVGFIFIPRLRGLSQKKINKESPTEVEEELLKNQIRTMEDSKGKDAIEIRARYAKNDAKRYDKAVVDHIDGLMDMTVGNASSDAHVKALFKEAGGDVSLAYQLVQTNQLVSKVAQNEKYTDSDVARSMGKIRATRMNLESQWNEYRDALNKVQDLKNKYNKADDTSKKTIGKELREAEKDAKSIGRTAQPLILQNRKRIEEGW